MVHSDGSTDIPVLPFCHPITFVDRDIGWMMVGKNNTQLFSWDWPGDDESILPTVSSFIDMTILIIPNAAIAAMQDPSHTI
jgi:hypothetical protein